MVREAGFTSYWLTSEVGQSILTLRCMHHFPPAYFLLVSERIP
jgi:hypothetical protein